MGDRLANINSAIVLINQKIGCVEKKSSVYCSPPWGFDAKEDFYNAVIKVNTQLQANDLLEALSKIETELGRQKKTGTEYESRIIDLDILDFAGLVLATENLILPHSQMHLRKFVLVPLHEIEPNWAHPIFKQKANALLKRINTNDFIQKLTKTND